jgi:hypothetical protein
LDHLDFTVGSVGPKTLERVYRDLLKNGGRPTRYTPSTTDGWAAMVKDPDGIWIRVGRSPTRSDQRNPRRPELLEPPRRGGGHKVTTLDAGPRPTF